MNTSFKKEALQSYKDLMRRKEESGKKSRYNMPQKSNAPDTSQKENENSGNDEEHIMDLLSTEGMASGGLELQKQGIAVLLERKRKQNEDGNGRTRSPTRTSGKVLVLVVP